MKFIEVFVHFNVHVACFGFPR